MNNTNLFKVILSISFCLLLFSCSHTKKDMFPDPEIKAGIAILSGKIFNYHLEEGKENPVITLHFSCPVTAETNKFETQLDDDGCFYFEEIPIECNTIGFINSYIFNGVPVAVRLVSDEETKVEIIFEKDGSIETNMTNNIGLTADEMISFEGDFWIKFLQPQFEEAYSKCYDMKPEEYYQYAMEMMKKRIELALDSSFLSPKVANYISNEFKLIYLKGALLNYSDYISQNYLIYKTEEEPDDFTPQEPSKSYYTFLKDFDLNNPQYLYNDYYPQVLERILMNDTLNIPLIDDMPINEWMKKVKAIMTEWVGFDKGLFYDMLAANSYARQFNNELRPLSDKQKENIKNYFKGKKGEIAKILLRRNDEIIKLAARKDPLVVNETPVVSKEKLMDTIISKYKGKVVVVDFWATWCAPCLNAMKEYGEVKNELKGKGVVFVYFTNGSSPKKLWQEKIEGIGGEHYYLNAEEWEYLMESFDFEGIPSYLIFDTKGELCHRFTGYPGNEEMQKMIENLLP